jgi:hypothetical protein
MTGHPGAIDHAPMASTRIRSTGKGGDDLVGPLSGLVDDMLDRFVDWREGAAAVVDAYRRWCEAPLCDEAWRFGAYLAALDQEESAAKSYAVVVADLDRWLQRAELRMRRRSKPHAGGTS